MNDADLLVPIEAGDTPAPAVMQKLADEAACAHGHHAADDRLDGHGGETGHWWTFDFDGLYAFARAVLASKDAVPDFEVKNPKFKDGFERFDWLCSLLPEGTNWGDSLDPNVLDDILLAAASTAPAQSCGDAEQADEAVTLPIMRAAFRVVETEGDPDPDKQRFHLRFTFRSMRELDAACDEWRAFSNAARAKGSK